MIADVCLSSRRFPLSAYYYIMAFVKKMLRVPPYTLQVVGTNCVSYRKTPLFPTIETAG